MSHLSDGRYMTKPEDVTDVLTKIAGLSVRSCEDTRGTGSRRYSLCGEEVAQVFPFAATANGIGMYSVDYEMLVPVLVRAIQELAATKKTAKKAAKAE